ncbi:hypothetical protein JYQ62_33775 [Nostoc sp. UHCC 0702]|nr:hypothetical protein JYQ62_33775 [Nostoc sp. UHCC 0702]
MIKSVRYTDERELVRSLLLDNYKCDRILLTNSKPFIKNLPPLIPRYIGGKSKI